MVMCTTCSGDGMLIYGIERARCTVSTGRGSLGCDDSPCRIVTCTGGEAIFVRFDRPWFNGVSTTGTLSAFEPCGPSISETVVLRFALGLS